MTNTKHTPGPWTYDAANTGSILHPYGVVQVGGESEEREANARLIAAAPELLEVAKRMLAFEQRLLASNDGGPQLASDIRAAIAKAEGSK